MESYLLDSNRLVGIQVYLQLVVKSFATLYFFPTTIQYPKLNLQLQNQIS